MKFEVAFSDRHQSETYGRTDAAHHSRGRAVQRFPIPLREQRYRRATHSAAFSCRLEGVTNRKTPTIDPQSVPAAELRREGRLTRISKALASGATVTDIAETEGISRTLTSRVANSPKCRQLIAEFVNSEFEEIRAMFYRCLRAIEHAMIARREYLTKQGQIIYGGPDHHARLAATKHFVIFLTAVWPAPKQPEKAGAERDNTG